MAGYKDAVTIEEAVEGVKRIKRRRRIECVEEREAQAKAKITLSTTLDAWMKRDS